MIQARIPASILKTLPAGTRTDALLNAIRSGDEGTVPPDLVAWVRRNGFDAGEPVELLPAVVPPRPTPKAWERIDLERDLRFRQRGRLALATGALLLIPTVLVYGSLAGNDAPVGFWPYAYLLVLFTLVVHLAPVPVLLGLAIAALRHGPAVPISDHRNEIVALVLWTLATIGTIVGYALIAGAKRVSGWSGLLGVFSLRYRDPRTS